MAMIRRNNWIHGVAVILLIVFICVPLSDTRTIKNKLSEIESIIHNKGQVTSLLTVKSRTKNFNCKHPQPRAYQVSDLLADQANDNKISNNDERKFGRIYSPDYIVIYRCDGHAGCCQNLHTTCMPTNITVETIFMEYRSVNELQYALQEITIEQHTRCNCQSANAADRKRWNLLVPKVQLLN